MNESMPPESSALTPEEQRRRAAAVTDPTDRRKYDDLIAVVVALLGIGSVLWFVLGRSNLLTAHLPFSGAAVNGNSAAIDANGNGLNSNGLAHGAKSGDGTATVSPIAGVATKSANSGGNPADVAAGLGAAAGIGAAVNNAGAPAKVNPVAIQPAATVSAPAATTAAPTITAEPSPTTATAPMAAESPKVVIDAPLPKPTQAAKFSDVPSTAAIAPYVTALSSRGLMSGFKDNTFQPDKPITRAEFAGILQKAFEKQRAKPALSFNDIKDAADLAAITEATQTGFMNGFPDKSFKPNLQIPRYQMQVALVTGLGLNPSGDPVQTLSTYADAQELPKWSVAKVATAVQSGIIAPDTKGLDPNHPATRGDAVVLIHQALVKDGKLPAIK